MYKAGLLKNSQNKPLATICECSAEYFEKLISLPARGIAKV
jgi:hypothetical protein